MYPTLRDMYFTVWFLYPTVWDREFSYRFKEIDRKKKDFLKRQKQVPAIGQTESMAGILSEIRCDGTASINEREAFEKCINYE